MGWNKVMPARWQYAFLLVLLASGCATPSKKVLPPPKAPLLAFPAAKKETPKIFDDVLVFLDLQEVDLDADGKKEIVAVYATGKNASGVKVIKFSNGKGDVIFSRIFNSKNTKFKNRNGIPSIISEDYDSSGRKFATVYFWDGKAFSLKEKQ